VSYTNLDGTTPEKGLADLLRWRLGERRKDTTRFTTPVRDNDGTALSAMTPHLTWIGHATFALRLGGKMIVTDPIWSERLGPQRRRAPPGVARGSMPPIDIVTVSHSHYDHLDLPTLRRIGPSATYVVPRDVGEILVKAGLPRVVELGWWDTHTVGSVRITLVPAQHWSMRVPWDRNKRLWGGFVIESDEGRAYHAGDTAFSERVFSEIHARTPNIDWAMLPIGAYDPPWFMQPQHMGPEEAGRAFEILGAKHFCAMHWGTFKLTDEPLGEPPDRLRTWWHEHGKDPAQLHVFDVGETMPLRFG
jgi:L-ascorbate metabolism protein UlaG (beta-lactamase superfamily)